MTHEEDQIQIACVNWFNLQYPKLALLLHHSPNGGKGQDLKLFSLKEWAQELVFLT